ncbi:MAG: hypothetical protein Q9228_005098, partial [Teloschistes exilis]
PSTAAAPTSPRSSKRSLILILILIPTILVLFPLISPLRLSAPISKPNMSHFQHLIPTFTTFTPMHMPPDHPGPHLLHHPIQPTLPPLPPTHIPLLRNNNPHFIRALPLLHFLV